MKKLNSLAKLLFFLTVLSFFENSLLGMKRKPTDQGKNLTTKKYKYQCSVENCCKGYNSLVLLNDHQIVKHSLCPWNTQCNKKEKFTSLEILYTHIKEEHFSETFHSCNKCNKYLSTQKCVYENHYKNCTASTNSSVECCGKKFSSKQIITHKIEKHRCCPWSLECKNTHPYNSAEELYNHITATHKSIFICNACKIFTTQDALIFNIHHMLCIVEKNAHTTNIQEVHQLSPQPKARRSTRTKPQEKIFYCPDKSCSAEFIDYFSLDVHQIKEHKLCPWCNVKHSYESVESLHNHIITTHQNIEYYYRNLCEQYELDQLFYFEPTPQRSATRYFKPSEPSSSDKKFKCPDERCSIEYTCASSLEDHEMMAHQFCPWCPDKIEYKSIQILHKHITANHPDAECFFCDICKSCTSNQLTYLQVHQQSCLRSMNKKNSNTTNNNQFLVELVLADFSLFDEFDESLDQLLFETELSKIKAGIINESGTDCFMNASLQVLNNIPSIIEALDNTNPLAGTLIEFFTKLRSEKIVQTGSMELRNTLTTMTNNYTLSTMQFGQQDAQEFISSLLDELNTENDNVQDVFKMEIQSHAVCYKGEHSCEQTDPAWLIPLNLPDQRGTIALQALVDNFNKQESIEDFYCDECNLYGIKRTILFKKLPKVFVASTKRFAYEDGILQRINTPVNIEENITLHDETGAVNYKLRAVILHHFSDDNITNLGHYTAQVKDCNNGLWYHYDDSYAQEISLEEVIGKSSQAYIYFYEQVLSNPQQEFSTSEFILN
jgi:hypothetical protein